jgi:phosphatidylglycerophosphate synthase
MADASGIGATELAVEALGFVPTWVRSVDVVGRVMISFLRSLMRAKASSVGGETLTVQNIVTRSSSSENER